MNTSLSIFDLKINSELFSSKRKEIDQLIGSLKLDDVKEDSQFELTSKRIKKAILLKPVTFQEPKIVNNSQIEKNFFPSYQNMFGGRRKVNVITIEFKFDGSPELFMYVPANISINGTQVYQPDYGNTITIDLELPSLDKTIALNSARDQMKTTFDIIQCNNSPAQQWSTSMEPIIESLMVTKRKELLDLYS